MSKNWTPKQKLAIETRGKTLLVSAAAGSGKTATLTERIVRRITDENSPASISRMLIVTFTRLSALDLKRKISQAISEELAKNPTDSHLAKQLVLLEGAYICTIDSFYLDIVRSNFQKLGLPSSFRLADEGEMALLRKEVMDSIIEKHYDASADDDGFLTFIENFTTAKQSDLLSEVFLSLEEKLSSTVLGINTLTKHRDELIAEAEGDFFKSRQGRVICKYLLGAAKSYARSLERCCDIISMGEESQTAYLPAFSYEKNFFEEFAAVLEKESYAEAREKLASFNKQKLGGLSKELQTDDILMCKALREEEGKFLTSINKKYFSFDEDEIKSIMLRTAEVLSSLLSIFSEFQAECLAEKIKRRAFGFDDIRYFTHLLLSDGNGHPSEVALAYRDRFDEIYVDEYQDVDAMQDEIFSLISNGKNRFMVGDIKQSIYSFRGADPTVFAGYKKSFSPIESNSDADEALIFMSNNFRCDENVIDFTNKVFAFLFGHCGESIEYTPEDDLIFSKLEEGRTLPSPKVQITVVTGDEASSENESEDEAEREDINPEAIWIAKEIKRLTKHELKADGTPIELRDIAIIMQSTTPAEQITKALTKFGIPCADNSKYDLFETPDVLLCISLLSCIDNPHRDIPLAATLYSPIFAYSMDDLITIRKSADPSASLFEALHGYADTEAANDAIVNKNKYFLGKLTDYRERARSLSVDKLINHIYRDLSLKAFEGLDSLNLTRLYEMARKFESGSFKGLNNFISYVNELIENKKVPSLTNEDSGANVVQMITAHKSKGLEFPVCFICNAQGKFNMDDLKANMLYSPGAGIALKLALRSGMANLDTPLREAIALDITDSQLEERMRVLYVALTRARERLYVTAHTRTKLDKLDANMKLISTFADDFRIRKCHDWLSMILAAIYPLQSRESFVFTAIEKDAVDSSEEDAESVNQPIGAKVVLSDDDIKAIKERLDFKYPLSHLGKLPAKLSVSKLTPTVLDDIDNDAATLESFDEAKILEIEEFFESRDKVTSADKGTATHLFLQFCDFANAEANGVREELARLVEKHFIAPQVAQLIEVSQIEKFFESEFYSSLKGAKRTYREQRFNILLPASHFTQDEEFKADVEEQQILVQGVIDLFFEDKDGSLILCDYKTDYLTPEEMRERALVEAKMTQRHGKQLSYYAMAVERLLGKRPNKVYIYSLPFGDAVEIKV